LGGIVEAADPSVVVGDLSGTTPPFEPSPARLT
jgi:hypothetical protein